MDPYRPPLHDGDAELPRAPQLDAATAQAIGERIKRLNRNSLLFGAVGLALQVGKSVITPGGSSLGSQSPLGLLMTLVGTGLLIYALSLYARMRNQSPWWGALGLLSCFGLVGLLLLPKKCHFCGATTKAKQCARCGAPAPV